MAGFQQVDVARNQFDSKGLELAIQSMTQNLNNFYSTGTINEIGAIVAYGGTLPPTGFLLCDGTAISRSTFSALFAVLGTTYGVGDGSTTFNLPNLKGRVPVGLDTSQTEFNTMGKTGGHKLMQAHTHAESVGNGTAGGIALVAQANYTGGNFAIGNTTASTGGGNAENLQPYQVVNYIIRYALPAVDGLQKLPSIPYKAHVRATSNQTINDATYNLITLDAKDFDDTNMFNNTAGNYKFVCPVSGYYLVTFNVTLQDLGGKFVGSTIQVKKNGTVIHTNSNTPYPASSTATNFAHSFNQLLQFTTGEYLDFYGMVDTSDGTTGEVVNARASFILMSV